MNIGKGEEIHIPQEKRRYQKLALGAQSKRTLQLRRIRKSAESVKCRLPVLQDAIG